MENSVKNVESLCFGDGRIKWEEKGGEKRNSKFLLIVAEWAQILRGVAEVMYGGLFEGEASRRGAWCVVSWTDVSGGVLTQSKLNGKSDQKFFWGSVD